MDEESDHLWKLFISSVQVDNEAFQEEDDANDPEYDFLKDLESLEFEEDGDFKSIFDNNDYFDHYIADQTVEPSGQFSIENLVEIHNQIRCHTQQLTQTWMLALSAGEEELANKSKVLIQELENSIFFKFGDQSNGPSTETRAFSTEIPSSALKVISKEEQHLRQERNISKRAEKSTILWAHYREVLVRHPTVFCFDWALLFQRPYKESPSKHVFTIAEDTLIARFFKQASLHPGGKVILSKITESNLIQLKDRFFPDLSTKTLSLHFKRYKLHARQIKKCDNLDEDQRLKKFSVNPLVRHFMSLQPLKTPSVFSSPGEFGLKVPRWYSRNLNLVPNSSVNSSINSSTDSTINPVSGQFTLQDSTNNSITKKAIDTKYILPKGALIYQLPPQQLIVYPEEVVFQPQPSPRMFKNPVKRERHASVTVENVHELNDNDDFEDFEIENNACDLMEDVEDIEETQQSLSSNEEANDKSDIDNDNIETDDPNDLLALMQASWTAVHRRPDGPSGVNLKSKAEIRKHTKLFYNHLSKNHNGLSYVERRSLDSYITFHFDRMKTILTANEFKKFVNLISRPVDNNNLLEFYQEIQAFFKKTAKHDSCSTKKARELKIYSKLIILFFNFDQAQKLQKSFRHVHLNRISDFMSKVLLYIHYCYPRQEQRMLYTKKFASIMFKLSASEESFNQKLGKLKSVLKKMFKGNALLLQEFRGLLLNESPPEYLMLKNSDFEHIDIDKDSEFNSINVPFPESDSRFGTKHCTCKCHSNSASTSTDNDSELQHCVSCSIRMVSNRIFLPTNSSTGKKNQFHEYTVERREVEGVEEVPEKPWSYDENRMLMLTCREYMLEKDIKEYSEQLFDVVAQKIKATSNIDRDVKEISAKLSKLLDSFEKFINKS